MVSRRHFLSGLLVAGALAPIVGAATMGEAQAQPYPQPGQPGRPPGQRPPGQHPPGQRPPGPPPQGGPQGRPNRPPPSPRAERRPSPRRGYEWVPGFWAWDSRRRTYVWNDGRWINQRSGWRHRNPGWHRRGNQWVFDPGGWYR